MQKYKKMVNVTINSVDCVTSQLHKKHKIDENTDYKYFPASVAAICYSTVGWSRSSCEPEWTDCVEAFAALSGTHRIVIGVAKG